MHRQAKGRELSLPDLTHRRRDGGGQSWTLGWLTL